MEYHVSMKRTPLSPMAQAPLRSGRTRLSDEETEARMLHAATEIIERFGLTVSLDHISFEDVIQRAAVSRSAAYRRWPYKEMFFNDLLKELAKAARPAAVAGFAQTVPLLRGIALDHLDSLGSAEGRADLVRELIRRGALNDFETMFGSTEWRTYLALHSTFLSVADDDLRRSLQVALAESDRDFIARIARGWSQLAGLFGYRLRAELDATFETVATLASATLRGLVIIALSTPDIASRRLQARPLGATEAAAWSLAGLTAASIADAFLEPDPDIDWTPERLDGVRESLEQLAFEPSAPVRRATSRRRSP
jgi:AcrR family transcriptional regulator